MGHYPTIPKGSFEPRECRCGCKTVFTPEKKWWQVYVGAHKKIHDKDSMDKLYDLVRAAKWFATQRRRSGFSYRKLTTALGLRSKTYLQDVEAGRRPLTTQIIDFMSKWETENERARRRGAMSRHVRKGFGGGYEGGEGLKADILDGDGNVIAAAVTVADMRRSTAAIKAGKKPYKLDPEKKMKTKA